MFIKLGIIIGIVVLGGMIFSNEIYTIFPSTSAAVVDSIKNDVSNFGTQASDSVEKRIDQSVDKIVDSTNNAVTKEISETGDKITNEIIETKESSQKIISEEILNLNPIESIKNIFSDNSEPETTQSSQSETIIPNNQSPLIHETLSLSTTHKSNDEILLQYSDSSEKTQSVDVIIRTNEKEIFSGTFFTSNFETTVHDISGIPYYVDMVVEHEDYGTVTSSVFNPGDSSDSQINGIFSLK
ncbi:hypothetical protein NKOR_09460 [Candidatus Nitrosopumilus koreensis AR1]|uniref:Uncharacterized protein n=1 Tax=Candidatus Nitrosopumilus koreensis AR1 TaxID=1229908 RepID=K0BBG4_9ARCH|nr:MULTISPECIES: hypothetical protein [Nitrosopumilus]AFS81741.1 hypothetical protein NKOR_09460 [Candidatus Nitrosopumilus koreensis AR1]